MTNQKSRNHLAYYWCKLFFLIGLFFLTGRTIYGQNQNITGQITDKESNPIDLAVILGVNKNFKIMSYTNTNASGKFSLASRDVSKLLISHINFKTDTIDDPEKELTIRLERKTMVLEEVILLKRHMVYENKNDTTTYDVESFTDGHERNVEDVLKNLPGVEVETDGTIYFRGKRVSDVLIEEEDLFGSGYSVGTKSMSPEYVEELEFINNYTEEELKADIVNSDQLALNLRLKDEFKLAVFGDMEAGLGLPKKYLLRGNIFNLTKIFKGALFGNLNNVSYENFDLQSYLNSENEFNRNVYNRSSDFISITDLQTVGGLSYDVQVYSRNNYVRATEIFKRKNFKSSIRLTASDVQTNNSNSKEKSFLNQQGNFKVKNEKKKDTRGLRIFNETEIKVSPKSKIKAKVEFTIDNVNLVSDHLIQQNTQKVSTRYSSNGKSLGIKLNTEYINKLSSNTVLTINYSRIEDSKIEASDNMPSNSEKAFGLVQFTQNLQQSVKDHSLEVGVLSSKGRVKRVHKMGVDLISDKILAGQNIDKDSVLSSQFSRDFLQPYVINNISYSIGKDAIKLLLKTNFSSAYNNAHSKNSTLFYDVSLGIKSSLSNEIKINGLIKRKRNIQDALPSSNITYFGSYDSFSARNVTNQKVISTIGLLGVVYSKPKMLLESNASIYYGIRTIPRASVSIDSFQSNSSYTDLIHIPTLSANFSIDKYLKGIKTNVNLDMSFFWLRSKNVFEDFNEYVTRDKKLGLTFSTNEIGFISMNMSHYLSRSEINSKGQFDNLKREQSFIEARYGLVINPPIKNDVQLEMSSKIYSTVTSFNYLENNIFSLALSYNISTQSNLSFYWKNIFNRSTHNIDVVEPYSTSEINSSLQPSFFYLTYSKKFSL